MDKNTIIGTAITIAALITITTLVFVARRIIERIAKNGYRTARETLKELNGGK